MRGFVETGLHFEKYHETPQKSENTGQSEATNNTVHRSSVFSDLKHCLCVDKKHVSWEENISLCTGEQPIICLHSSV